MLESQKQVLKFVGEILLWSILWIIAFVGIVFFIAEVSV